jgi:hypothetical protein
MLRRWRWGLMSFAAIAGVAAAIALPGIQAAPAQTGARPAKLGVGVEVLRFAAAGKKLTATGLVTAKLTDNSSHVTTVHTKVALSAAAGGGCRVLHLFLKELTLHLLGLNAHLDQVRLDITGNPGGGVLGSLFCKLARARIAAARASAARALTASIHRHGQHVLRFAAYFNPTATTSQAATAVCPVLDLVVGPLNLQLLGLVVNLNRVHLTITATRGAGALGDLFCKLADNSTTTTTTASATPTG